MEGNISSKFRIVLSSALAVFLPVAGVIATALAGGSRGTAKVLLVVVVVTITAGAGLLTLVKDRQAARAKAKAVAAITNLDTAVTGAGQPLVVALGRVTAETTLTGLQSGLEQLRQLAIMGMVMQCGKSDGECRLRGVYYTLKQGRLELDGDPIGRAAGPAPRQFFKPSDGRVSRRLIERAKGSQVIRIPNVDEAPTDEFEDYPGRRYKSIIAAPVRAGDQSFGLLIVDSDRAFSLTEADAEYVNLLAQILGAGYAHRRSISEVEANSGGGGRDGMIGSTTPRPRDGTPEETNKPASGDERGL